MSSRNQMKWNKTEVVALVAQVSTMKSTALVKATQENKEQNLKKISINKPLEYTDVSISNVKFDKSTSRSNFEPNNCQLLFVVRLFSKKERSHTSKNICILVEGYYLLGGDCSLQLSIPFFSHFWSIQALTFAHSTNSIESFKIKRCIHVLHVINVE